MALTGEPLQTRLAIRTSFDMRFNVDVGLLVELIRAD
jgi:hypothetical protein